MDDKQTPGNEKEEPLKTEAAQTNLAQAAGESPEAKLEEALASWPRNQDGALLDPETATQVSEGIWEGPLLKDGRHKVTAADGTEMEFEVTNNAQTKDAETEQAQAGQPRAEIPGPAAAEQPGLTDLPAPDAQAPEAPDAQVAGDDLDPIDKLQTEAVNAIHERMGIPGNPPQAVSDAVFKAVAIRLASAHEMVNSHRVMAADAMLRGTMDGVMEAAGSSAEKVTTQEIGKMLNEMVGRAMSEAISKSFANVAPENLAPNPNAPVELSAAERDETVSNTFANMTPQDMAPSANAPQEPSVADRAVVGKYTGELAKPAAAASVGGITR